MLWIPSRRTIRALAETLRMTWRYRDRVALDVAGHITYLGDGFVAGSQVGTWPVRHHDRQARSPSTCPVNG